MADIWPLNQQTAPDARMGSTPGVPGGGLFAGGLPDSAKGGIGNWGQTLGGLGSIAGLFAGPAGMAFGPAANLAGSWIDANIANRGLATQGLNQNVSAFPAAISNGMFGLMGRMGLGQSIADQVGGVKSEAARNDPRFGSIDFTDGTKWGGLGPLDAPSADKLGMDTQATKDAYVGGGDWAGGSVGKSGDSLGADYAGGNYGGSMDKGDSNDRGGGGVDTGGLYAHGGIVRRPPPHAANPPGPDNQLAGVQTGEGVVSRQNMQLHPALAMLVQRLAQGGR